MDQAAPTLRVTVYHFVKDGVQERIHNLLQTDCKVWHHSRNSPLRRFALKWFSYACPNTIAAGQLMEMEQQNQNGCECAIHCSHAIQGLQEETRREGPMTH